MKYWAQELWEVQKSFEKFSRIADRKSDIGPEINKFSQWKSRKYIEKCTLVLKCTVMSVKNRVASARIRFLVPQLAGLVQIDGLTPVAIRIKKDFRNRWTN